MIAYIRDFDDTKYMPSLIKDGELLEKYNEIWKKIKNSIEKGFDSETAYNEKYLKAKIKSYNGKINKHFHNNKMLKEGSQCIQCICLPVILINSSFRAGKNCYPQVFLEECKYVVKEKKIPEYITDDTEISPDDSDREDSDEENFNKENSDKKVLMKRSR